MVAGDLTVLALQEIASDVQDLVEDNEKLTGDVKAAQRRADLLAEDKLKLVDELALEKTRRRWQPLAAGGCPDDTRVLVRGKDKYVAFGTRSANGTWLSGRMLLEFDPIEWLPVPP